MLFVFFFRYTKVIRVTVLSGQHLPNSAKKGDIVDPYVQVKVRGHPLDKQKQRTKVVKNNGKFINFLHYFCQSVNESLHQKLFNHFSRYICHLCYGC